MRRKALVRGGGVAVAVLAVALLIPTARAQDVLVTSGNAPQSSDVLVLPPQNDAVSSSNTFQSQTPLLAREPAANHEAAQAVTPQTQALSDRVASESVRMDALPTAHYPPEMQCQVDGDCVFLGDNCGVYLAVNKKYATQENKGLPVCSDKSGRGSHGKEALAAMARDFVAVCKKQVCTLQSMKKANGQ